MEEINEVHSLQLEWGAVTNLADRISLLEDKIEGGWPELIDMIADAMTDSSGEPPEKIFFYLYAFMFRVYYRVKHNLERRPLNVYSREEWGSEKEEVYIISNYDFSVFKWAIDSGFVDRLSNERVIIPVDKLTTKQQHAFDRRCGKGKK